MNLKKGFASLPLIIVGVAILGILAYLFLGKGNINAPTLPKREAQKITTPISTQTTSSLNILFGPEVNTDFFLNRSPVNATPEGSLDHAATRLQSLYWGVFDITEKDSLVLNDQLGINPSPGTHHLFLTEMEGPPTGIGIFFQLGGGFTPPDYPSAPGDPEGVEPILQNPQGVSFFTVLFEGQQEGWTEVSPSDTINDFADLDGTAYGYMSAGSNIAALLIPEKFIGPAGHEANLTFQLFATGLGGPDDVGFTGSTSTVTVPDPLPSPIFTDGFESGDTSAWSNSLNN